MTNSLSKIQRGFSLLEVLVAVVILAVGILGVAGLQVASMQQNRSALFRTQAVQLANDMLDRMRANPDTLYSTTFADAPSATAPTCINSDCDLAQMAAFDIAQWKCSINSTDVDGTPYTICTTFGIGGSLPNGAGEVSLTAGEYAVSVRWQANSDGDMSTITLRTRTL